jgi:hypothetical protein
MFCAFYLLTLLRRMMSEPTTVFYLLFMVIKTMPHVPLALGLRQTYLRCALEAPQCGTPPWPG